MPLKWYWGDPGSSFNSSHVRNALDDRMGTEILLPVYRETRGGGSNFEYEVIGWVGWHLTGYQISGKGKLRGWFTRVIWEGIQTERRPMTISVPAAVGAHRITNPKERRSS